MRGYATGEGSRMRTFRTEGDKGKMTSYLAW